MNQFFDPDLYIQLKFCKTPLGALVLYAKQSQNKKLIKKIAAECHDRISKLIKSAKIDAVAWVPHTLPRKIPFLSELKRNLKLELPEIHFHKAYRGELLVPQKSLSKLEERIENAQNTLFLDQSKINYKKVLIIDDAVGSGATLQAAAEKIKFVAPRAKLYGLALVGSLKGFEVIKEV